MGIQVEEKIIWYPKTREQLISGLEKLRDWKYRDKIIVYWNQDENGKNAVFIEPVDNYEERR